MNTMDISLFSSVRKANLIYTGFSQGKMEIIIFLQGQGLLSSLTKNSKVEN